MTAMVVRLAVLGFALLMVPMAAVRAQDAVKMGERVGKLKFTDIRYLPRTLDDFGKKKAFVLVFTSTTCPLAQRYMPTLQGLAQEFREKDVQLIAVNAADEDSI